MSSPCTLRISDDIRGEGKVEVETLLKHEHAFFPPCFLGFSLALVLVLVPIFSAVYWACAGMDLETALVCPKVIETNRKSGPLGMLQRQKRSELVLALPPSPQPLECACRLLWNRWELLTTKRSVKTVPTSTCIPETVLDDGSDLWTSVAEIEPEPDPHLLERYGAAFTPERLTITAYEKSLIKQIDEKIKEIIPDWNDRTAKVRWGEPSGYNWYSSRRSISRPTDLEELPGGNLFYSYLRIMKWPSDLRAKFPFKLCSQGCNSEVALKHSLEFREKYRPWLVTSSVKQENSRGAIYVHGFGHPNEGDEKGAHALVWIRPGRRTKVNDIAYTRSYVNALETAVAASMKQSDGRVGKFNVIVDGTDFSWGLLPSLHQLKVFVTILQDHFPDRLGMILLTNLGRVGDIVVKLFLPLITEEVRNKIQVLPHESAKRKRALETVMPLRFIPTWLAGPDNFMFDQNQYYSNDSLFISDDEAENYLTTMPYHA